jgi:DNA-binding transcriptional ArsR family regulator
MDIRIDHDAAVPPYEQVRLRIAELAANGRLAAGAKLPPVRRLAADLGLAANTVARAYRELERAGLVETRGRGGPSRLKRALNAHSPSTSSLHSDVTRDRRPARPPQPPPVNATFDTPGGGCARGCGRWSVVDLCMPETGSTRALLDVLRTTDDGALRNRTAVTLSDRRSPELFDTIVALLTDERTLQDRGALLYALAPYDCAPILPLLIDLAIDGTFEERAHATELIDGVTTTLDLETWRRCADRLEAAVAAAGPDDRPALMDLLSLFR